MLGYNNCVLRIDMTTRTAVKEPLRMDWARKYIGSKGLAIKYLYELLAPGIDPLGPDNKLIFMTAPATGTNTPCTGKLCVAGKSPATGTICDCSIGGHIGLSIKYAGYDAILLEGMGDSPCNIIIDNGDVRFEDASEYWGKGSHHVESALTQRLGHDYSVLSIGPGGENKCCMACINSDYYRQAGRGGMGGVMGSKMVKAIAIRGTGAVRVPDAAKVARRLVEIERDHCLLEDNTYVFFGGTTTFVEFNQCGGILPYKNFSDCTDEKWTQYNDAAFAPQILGKRGCGSCALGCGNFMKIGDVICEGPEYETISVAGPNAGNADPAKMLEFNRVCDDMGLDTISAGDIIVWAMEMTEKGLYDFGIRFGEADKMNHYVELIARRTGPGEILSLGVKKASELVGGTDFAMQVKGLEFPQYEPRGSWGMALSYAVADRGACHMRAYTATAEAFTREVDAFTAEGKGQMVCDLTRASGARFSFGLCDFWATTTNDLLAEILTLVTGEPWTGKELDEVGIRVANLARAFNQREGFSARDDTIPKRILSEVVGHGPAAGQVIPKEAFEDMKRQYYAAMGWTEDGLVPEEILREL